MIVLLLVAFLAPADWLAKLRPAPPTVVVQAPWPGVAPADVEAMIVQPLESAISGLPGLARMDSVAAEGQATLTLIFDWGVPEPRAARRVRAAIDRARPQLPEDCEPAVMRTAGAEIWRRYAFPDDGPAARARAGKIAEALERFAGVTEVEVCGLDERRLEVALDPKRLRALSLTAAGAAQAIGAAQLGAGRYAVAAPQPPDAQVLSAVRLRPSLRLADVATVREVHEPACRCWLGGTPAVCLVVQGVGGAPLKLDEAAADAQHLPPKASEITAQLAEPKRGVAAAAAIRKAGAGPAVIQARETALTVRVPPAARAAILQALSAVPGVRVVHSRDPGEPVTEVWIAGPRDALEPTAATVRAALRAAAIARAVDDPTPAPKPELRVRLGPEGRRLGITPAQVSRAVRHALQGVSVSAGLVKVVQDPKPELPAIQLTTPSGAQVPLSAVADIQRTLSPPPTERRDGRPGRALWVVGATPAQVQPALAQIPLAKGVTLQAAARP